MKAKLLSLALVLLVIPATGLLAGCGPGEKPIGSPERPIKMAFVPYLETQKLFLTMKPFVDLVEKESGYKIDFSVPTSYAATIEAMGANKVDVAWYGPYAYVLAHDKFGAEVILTSVQYGNTKYRGQIIVRADSGLNSLENLKGKKFAFVESSSASGYLYPKALLVSKGYVPEKYFSDIVFAGGHDKVIIAVYNKQVDAGAIYEEARTTLEKTLPDIMAKTKVIAYTDWIPNDNVAVRKGLPKEVKDKLTEALVKVVSSPEGKKALKEAIGTEGFALARDSDYDPIRQAARVLTEEERGKLK
ncbi:MAG: phosphate/phosphite/phosphonate ABC transporter substrate-binding protein [Chloroflexi bacterium]|nr:phosphate/phosphite/phosphonate ABC transporter substrate-binding protein [Chloroflexota bacterium]